MSVFWPGGGSQTCKHICSLLHFSLLALLLLSRQSNFCCSLSLVFEMSKPTSSTLGKAPSRAVVGPLAAK